MDFNPHPYQQRAMDFAASRSCLLGLECGLGKTPVTALVALGLFDQCEVTRGLVVAPKRVAEHTWPNELRKWSQLHRLKVVSLMGTPSQRVKALQTDAHLYLINPELIQWLIRQVGKDWPFDLLILDESTRFKDSGTKRWKAIRRILPKVVRSILLSGTAISNSYLDLWAQLFLIDRGARLGRTYTEFRDRFFLSDYMGFKWTPRPGAVEEMQRLVSDVVLAMRAEDWLTVPESVVVDVPVTLPPDALKAYKTFERNMLLELDTSTLTALSAGALVNKLAQFACGQVYDQDGNSVAMHTGKLEALEEIVEDAASPVMVVYSFRFDLDSIKVKFPGAVEARDPGAIDAWNAGQVRMLLVHPQSAGYGLNLQDGGHHIVWYGLTASLEQYLQTNARLHRQGQKHTVFIHRLISQQTVDERLVHLIAHKREGLEGLLYALRG